MLGGDREQTRLHGPQRDFMLSVQTTCDMVCDGWRDYILSVLLNLLTIGGLSEYE